VRMELKIGPSFERFEYSAQPYIQQWANNCMLSNAELASLQVNAIDYSLCTCLLQVGPFFVLLACFYAFAEKAIGLVERRRKTYN